MRPLVIELFRSSTLQMRRPARFVNLIPFGMPHAQTHTVVLPHDLVVATPQYNPRPVPRHDVERILHSAWAEEAVDG